MARVVHIPIVVAVVAALLLAGCGGDGGAPGETGAVTSSSLAVDGPGRYEATMVSGGVERSFVLHVPVSASLPAPLVIVLHGFTGHPETAADLSGMHEIGEIEGFLTVYPAALGVLPAWRADAETQGDRDLEFLRDLVGVVGAAVPVDADRVFVAGMSNGGGMANRLACDASDLVAAIGPVAGAYSTGPCAPMRPVPVVAFHGTGDPIVPYAGLGRIFPPIIEWAGAWAGRNGCGAGVVSSEVTSDVTLHTWESCAADVALYEIAGGGHGWPGSQRAARDGSSTDSVSASAVIWEFFSNHPMG